MREAPSQDHMTDPDVEARAATLKESRKRFADLVGNTLLQPVIDAVRQMQKAGIEASLEMQEYWSGDRLCWRGRMRVPAFHDLIDSAADDPDEAGSRSQALEDRMMAEYRIAIYATEERVASLQDLGGIEVRLNSPVDDWEADYRPAPDDIQPLAGWPSPEFLARRMCDAGVLFKAGTEYSESWSIEI